MTTGTHGAATFVAAGGTNVNYKDVAEASGPGLYLTQTLRLDIGSGTETIKDGEVFTIGGVFAYDNRLQAPLTHLQEFRVIGDFTASGGVVNPVVFPAIVIPSAFSSDQIVNNNTANATVSAAPIDGATVTFISTASSSLKPRAILNKDAIVVNTADLILPATGIGSRKSLIPEGSASSRFRMSAELRVTIRVNMKYAFDVALNCRTWLTVVRIVRINGS